MNLEEIREKYPQYNDLSDEQLVTGVHKKFYSDMDFADFSQRIGYQPTDSRAISGEASSSISIGQPDDQQPSGFVQSMKEIGLSGTTEAAKDFMSGAIGSQELRQKGEFTFADPNEEEAFNRTIQTQEMLRGEPLSEAEINEIRNQYQSVPPEAAQKQIEDWETTLRGIEEKLPDLPERERSKLTQAMMGMARFAPTMAVSAVSPGAGAGMTMAQLYGNQYGEYRKQGVDPETANTAAFATSVLSTPVEYAGNLFQLRLIAKSLGFGTKQASSIVKFLTQARSTIPGRVASVGGRMAAAGAAEGLEEGVQAYAEAAGDIIAENPDADASTMFQKYSERIGSDEFKQQRNAAAEIGFIGGAVLGGGGAAIGEVRQGVGQSQKTADKAEMLKAIQEDIKSGVVTKEGLQELSPKLQELHGVTREDLDAAYAEVANQGTFETKIEAAQDQVARDTVPGTELQPPRITTIKPGQKDFITALTERMKQKPKSAEESAQVFQEEISRQDEAENKEATQKAITGLTETTGKSAQQSAQDMAIEQELQGNEATREQAARESETRRQFDRLAKIWDSLSDSEKDAEISRIEQERAQKESKREFTRRTPEQRSIEAERKLKEADRLGLKLDPDYRAQLEKDAIPPQAEAVPTEMRRVGAWEEPTTQEPQNAESIREDEGQIQERGVERQGREGEGREDLQLKQEEGTKAGYEKEQIKTEQATKKIKMSEAVAKGISPGGAPVTMIERRRTPAEQIMSGERTGRRKPENLGRRRAIDAQNEFNGSTPGHDVKFDGVQDRSAIGKPPMYSYTAQSGPAKGASFNVEEPTTSAINEKLNRMIEIRKPKSDGATEVLPKEQTGEKESVETDQDGISKRLQKIADKTLPKGIKADEKGSAEINLEIVRHAHNVIKKGVKNIADFSLKMRKKFKSVWEKIRPHIRKLYGAIKADLKDERGVVKPSGIEPSKGGTIETVEKEQIVNPLKSRKEGDLSADAYAQNRKKSAGLATRAMTSSNVVVQEIKDGFDKILGVSSTRLGNVSKKLKHKVRKLDYDISTKSQEDVKKIVPLLKKARKRMTGNDYADWDYARKNSDSDMLWYLTTKYNLRDEYKTYRETLDGLRKEGIDVGLDIGEIQDYSPRRLKDKKGFLKALYNSKDWDIYSRAIKEKAVNLGVTVAEMDEDIKADIISNMIAGQFSGLGGVPATKARKLKVIPPELNKYYMDSDAALMSHIYSMRKAIEARKFFGKIPKKVSEMKTRLRNTQRKLREIKDNMDGNLSASQKRSLERYKNTLEKQQLTQKEKVALSKKIARLEAIKQDTLPDEIINELRKKKNRFVGLEKQYQAYIDKYAMQRDYRENIGSYILELIEKKEIKPDQEKTVHDILMARFHEKGTHGIWQMYKNFSYMDTMGSPISALTQIGDLAWAAYEGGMIRGFKNVAKAVAGKSRIKRKDVGFDRIAQEFEDSTKLGKAVNAIFKASGLEKMDGIGTESLLNTSLEKYQKKAKKNSAKLKKDLKPIFEGETDQLIDDLKNDKITDNVKLLVYSRVLDFQPKALSETPEFYLKAGNGRVFYMLKTFTLKQFDIFRNEVYNKMKYGKGTEKLEGIRNFARLAFFFTIANAGADEIKDWILRRETTLSDRVVDNILRLFGVSKFITWQARREGIGTAAMKQILPPAQFVDSVYKDILSDEKTPRIIKSIPIGGKIAYWHLRAEED